ncbi:AAA family ATPase [Microbaculum sp. FT89]|uniref:AAA family ATPase n=1 Tax=Microbaculum sp. FT89 TaxID=3447298 RepID=UPI003F52DE26
MGPGPAPDRRIIVVISQSADVRQALRSRLSAVPAYEVIDLDIGDTGPGSAGSTYADLVLIDVGDGEVLDNPQLADVLRGTGDAPRIVLSGDMSAEGLRRVVQLSASDWLKHPIDNRQLLEAVAAQVQTVRHGQNRVLAFVPAVGGAGATSLSIAAAASAAKSRKRAGSIETCLVDLDFTRAAAGTYLDLAGSEFDVGELVQHPERIDLELLDIIKREHAAGFAVLSLRCPHLEWWPGADEFIFRLLDIAAYRYPTTVIDLPSHDAPWRQGVLNASDLVTVVTEATIPALRFARDLYAAAEGGGVSAERLNVVVNKVRSGLFSKDLSKTEMKSVFTTSQLTFLPEDWALASEALNRGLLWRDLGARSGVVKEFEAWLEPHVAAKKSRSSWFKRS